MLRSLLSGGFKGITVFQANVHSTSGVEGRGVGWMGRGREYKGRKEKKMAEEIEETKKHKEQ